MMTNNTGNGKRGMKVSRRKVLQGAAATAVGLSVPIIWRRARAQSKRIVVKEPGGPFTVAWGEAYFKPFQEATGIEVVGVVSGHEPTSEVIAMVDTKTYAWDMSTLTQAAADQLVQMGSGYLEKLEIEDDPNVREIPPQFKTPYWVGDDVFAAVLAYRTDAFKGRNAPSSWKDLWDVQGFPGRRSLHKHPFDTIEIALLADGVPKERLYPCDIDRAFKSLDKIKPHITMWWTGASQSTQVLITGEIDLLMIWNARAQTAIDEGAPVAMAWDQNLWSVGGWGILKGGPNVDLCRQFIKFVCNAQRQAATTRYLAFGPTNPNAFKYIDPKRARMLPTYPEYLAKGIQADYRYWGANKDKVTERFTAWMIS